VVGTRVRLAPILPPQEAFSLADRLNVANNPGYQWPGLRNERLLWQNKGHKEELEAFSNQIAHGGGALIPWRELEEVTLATFLAVEKSKINNLDQLALTE